MIFSNYLYKKSYIYKNNIIWSLEKNVDKSWIKRLPYFNKYSSDLEKLTINYMKKGIPIIVHGMVANSINKEYITPDILIRNDYINKIFPNKFMRLRGKSRFGNYYYLIFSIKFFKLHFTSNFKYLLNLDLALFSKST